MLADAGFSVPQIKRVTGHKSDTFVQGYIDQSLAFKRTASDALAVESSKRPRDESSHQQPAQAINIYISNTTKEPTTSSTVL